MAKPKRKPYTPPPQGDPGPDTPAQMEGAIIITLQEANGTTFRRKRRDHAVTTMAKRGQLTTRQAAAGMELADRYEDTMRSPGVAWARCFVDSTPRPGDVSVAQLEAKHRWAELSRHIPRDARGVTMAVCCHSLSIMPGFTRNSRAVPKYREALCKALDLVADAMRLR